MRAPGRDTLGFVLTGVVVATLGWNELALTVAATGPDASWNAGLSMAAEEGLQWGREVVFTFGPLGYLKHPTFWYESTGTLAIAYTFVTRVALAGALWYFGRAAFGRVGAAVVALVVVPFVQHPLPPLVFGWAMWLLVRERTSRAWLAFAVCAGVIGGLELLVKVNIGVLLVALGGATVAFAPRDRLRCVLVWAASVAAGLVAGWLATGQRLLDLNDYLINAGRIASGYSMAMLSATPSLAWHYSAALIIFGILAYAAWSATATAPTRARVGALAVALVLSFVAFKNAFVRQDQPHAAEYFALLLPALVVIPWARARRATGVIAVAGVLLVMMGLTARRLDDVVSPVDRAGEAWEDVSLLGRPAERDRWVARLREHMQDLYKLDPAIVELLRGHRVHVEPYETAIVWAYDLAWRPAPVYQSYQAYTHELDRLNEELLLGSAAPSRILVGRQESVDGRVAAWESPAAVRAILCRYQAILERGDWLVLGRAEDRCGDERLIASRRARWGESVPDPPPRRDGIVMVRVHGAGPGLWERVRSALFKGHERSVELNDDGAWHPFVPGTAESGLLLHAPDGVELPAGFSRAPSPRSLALHHEGGADGTLRYDFYVFPVEGPT